MKKKWNEKTKKFAVIVALATVGVGVLAGISLCIYKDTPQKVEIHQTELPEDMVDIPETDLNVPAIEGSAVSDSGEIIVSTEISQETGTEKEYVQSLQPTPVKTEDQKPDEKTMETKDSTGDRKESTPKSTEKLAEQQTKEEQSSGNTDSPKQGEVQGDKIYVEGFGWVDYNGGGTTEIPAPEIYENGNEIGIMD